MWMNIWEWPLFTIYINIRVSDIGAGGVPDQIYWKVIIEPFKELGKWSGVMRSKDKYVINKQQPKLVFLQFRMKEI
jgi:hypothetical protein